MAPRDRNSPGPGRPPGGIDVAKHTCTVKGCDRDHYGHGLCHMHYQRLKAGRPLSGTPHLTRFWLKVRPQPNGCWYFAGPHDRHGYARFNVGPKAEQAHRWFYEQLHGSLPDATVLDHFHCDDPGCVNPMHVWPVRQRQNLLRGDTIPAWNISKIACHLGHAFDAANTYYRPNGDRGCRQCGRDQARRRRMRNRNPISTDPTTGIISVQFGPKVTT